MEPFYLIDGTIVMLEGSKTHQQLWLDIVRCIIAEQKISKVLAGKIGAMYRAYPHGFYEDGYIYITEMLTCEQAKLLKRKFGQFETIYVEECYVIAEQAEIVTELLGHSPKSIKTSLLPASRTLPPKSLMVV